MSMQPDIETLLPWGSPRELPHLGKIVRSAAPTDAFWALWREHGQSLRQAGISVGQFPKGSGTWQVSFWQSIGEQVAADRREASNLSRAAAAVLDLAIPCPEGLSYMPFQRAGIEFVLRLFEKAKMTVGALIADEMGLGKTIQAIGVINAIPSIERVLVVCPASLKENWRRELKKWLVRPLHAGIAEGRHWPGGTAIVVINYDLAAKFAHKMRSVEWDLIILDESQRIKNPRTARTKAILGSRKNGLPPIPARYRICLSGTPIENRPIELWTTLCFLDPNRWGNYWGYAKRYAGMVNNGYGMDVSGASNLDELQRILRETLMIRRLKADVLTDLPPKTRLLVELNREGLEQVIAEEEAVMVKYREQLERAQAEADLARAADNDGAFNEAVKKLNDANFGFTEIARARHNTAVAMLPACIEAIKADIEDSGNRKVLIFGHHADVLLPIHAAFAESVLITGEVAAGSRQAICDRFQNNPDCGPFIGSMRACGMGLTLTAATTVYFVESDWTPGVNCQAEDRAHRIGQKGNVLVKYFVLPGTISAKMLKTTLAKQEVIDQALDKACGDWPEPPTFVPTHKPLARRTDIHEEALLLTRDEMAQIHADLKRLAGVFGGAIDRDGAGFNGVDARIGHSLANCPSLTPRQAVIGKKLLVKYKQTQLCKT